MPRSPISFDDFYNIVQDNLNNPALTIDLVEYRKTHPTVTLNRDKFLSKLLMSFGGKQNLFYDSVKNIIERDEFKIIPLEDFFDKIFKIFNDIVIKIEQIISSDENAIIHFYFDELAKSNFWLCLLFAKHIKDNSLDTKFKNYIYFVEYYGVLGSCSDKNNYIIFLDDCSYSGTQLSENIGPFTQVSYIKGIYLYIPYISSIALEKLESEIGDILEINHEEELFSMKDDNELLKVILENNLVFLDENNEAIINIMQYLFMKTSVALPSMLEIKNADALSVYQNLFNYVKTPKRLPEKLKIYRIKKNKLEDLADEISAGYNFFGTNYDNKNFGLIKKYFELIQEDVTFEQVDEYLDETIGLLDNCYQEKYTDIIDNKKPINLTIDYSNDELCFSAFYRKVPIKISSKTKEILKANIMNPKNMAIVNNPVTCKNIKFIEGGSYYEKYMKYKIKYLELKKINIS